MKEQTMKETTLKVKNQTTTLQKAIILGDIVFMIGSFSVFLCNLLISYILYRNEGKEGAALTMNGIPINTSAIKSPILV